MWGETVFFLQTTSSENTSVNKSPKLNKHKNQTTEIKFYLFDKGWFPYGVCILFLLGNAAIFTCSVMCWEHFICKHISDEVDGGISSEGPVPPACTSCSPIHRTILETIPLIRASFSHLKGGIFQIKAGWEKFLLNKRYIQTRICKKAVANVLSCNIYHQ